jgi:hypothetical protein
VSDYSKWVCGLFICWLVVGRLVGFGWGGVGWTRRREERARCACGASRDRYLARLKWMEMTHPSRLFSDFSLSTWKVGADMVVVYNVEERLAHPGAPPPTRKRAKPGTNTSEVT